jgi:phosphinothricin acetyltransferase
MNVVFEPLTEKHGADVMKIFNYYIDNGFAAYPDVKLPDQFFPKFLELTKGYPSYVMIRSELKKVIGFCFLRPYNPFSTFKRTAEITYFIEPEETGKGLGKLALDKLESEARKMGIKNILADISSLNKHSLTFHIKNGFTECGRLTNIGEKKGIPFDVIWMQKDLSNEQR